MCMVLRPTEHWAEAAEVDQFITCCRTKPRALLAVNGYDEIRVLLVLRYEWFGRWHHDIRWVYRATPRGLKTRSGLCPSCSSIKQYMKPISGALSNYIAH